MGPTILRQKLKPPVPWAGALRRQRLLDCLDEALDAGQHVALVAGSGHGKTSLLADWCQRRSTAWISLDAEDADLDSFLGYLVAAFERAIDGFSTEARGMLPRARERDAALATLSTLLADLDEQCEGPLVLVLDDYHLASSPTLDSLLERLIKYLPSGVRLLFASRQDPGIPMATLQAKRVLKVLREPDLRLDLEELRSLRPELGAGDLAELMEQTGGWPAAMGMTRELLDAYLDEELLGNRPEDQREFLLRAALVDGFEPASCEEAFGLSLEPSVRESLVRDRLLLPLEEGGLHVPQPLRGMLRRRLMSRMPGAERQGLLRRLGDHLWRSGQAASALHFWIDAGQSAWAAEKLIEVCEEWLAEGRLEALSSAIAATGRGRSPSLSLAEGEVFRRWGDFERAEAAFEEAWRGFPDQTEGRARARLRQALLAASCGKVDLARERLGEADEAIALGNRPAIDAQNVQGGLELLAGSTAKAIEHFEASLRLGRRIGDPYAEARAIHNLGVCYGRLGEFPRALECYDAALAAPGPGGTPTVWMTAINRALALVYLDRVPEAIEAAEAALELVRRFRLTREEGYALRTLGFARFRSRQHEAARTCFESAELLARFANDTLGLAYSLNFQAELAAATGQVDQALRLLDEVTAALGIGSPTLRLPEFVQVKAKVLLAANRAGEAAESIELLRQSAHHESQRAMIQELESLMASSSVPEVPSSEEAAPDLVIDCLGGLRVRRSGQEVGEREWQSARAKLLLAFLAHTPEGAHKGRLMEVLYPDTETTDASLNMNLMRLRKALEPSLEKGQPSRYILRSDGRYTFNRQAHVVLDTVAFESALRGSRALHGHEEAAALRRAIACYGGEFLPEFDHEWVVAMRQKFRDLALGACRRLLELLEDAPLQETLEVVQRALEIDPLSEEFHREVILRFLEADEPHRAMEHYRLCERRFRESLGMAPPTDLATLVADLRA